MKLDVNEVYAQILSCHKCPLATVVDGRPTCGFNGKEILFFDKGYGCPKGLWKQKTVYMYNADPNPPAGVPEGNGERAKAKSFWESLTALPGQAIQLVQVKTSGQADPEVVSLRRSSCASCPARKGPDNKSIPAGVAVGPDQWCGDCGCGIRPWAKLDEKLEHAYLPCPRQRPGFSNESVSP